MGASVNNEVIQPFQNANNIIYKYNQAIQHGTLTQDGWNRLLAQSDDGLKSYLTSIKGSTASMTGYNVSLQGNIKGFSKVSSALKQYNTLGATSATQQKEFATAVGLTNSKFGSYLVGLNGSKASLIGYGASLVAAKAKTIALTSVTTTLNAALTMGVSYIITSVISAISSWVNASDKIIEKAEEAKNKIDSINQELKTSTETVDKAKTRYAEFAQEVKNLGKVNQSQGTLTTDEYEEFLDLSNQLAEVFPQLRVGFDENSNSILNLSGSVNTIVDSLDALIQKEKEMANIEMMKQMPDVYDGYIEELKDAKDKKEKAQKQYDDIYQAYHALSNGRTVQMGFNYSGYNEDTNTHMGQYEQWLKTLGLTYEEIKVEGGYVVTAIGDINTAFKTKLKGATDELDYAKDNLESKTSSFSTYLNTWLQSEFIYTQIDNTDLQTAMQDMILNFDFSSLPKNIDTWEEAEEYLRNNILFAIKKAKDNPEVSGAISQIFRDYEKKSVNKIFYDNDRRKAGDESAFRLVLYISVPKGHVKSRRYFPPVLLADMSLIQANALRT